MIPYVIQYMEDIEILPIILGDGAFLLRTFMMKLYGDAILPDDKLYFDYRNSQLQKEHSEDWKSSWEFFFVNVKVIKNLSNYMACPSLCLMTFALNAVI